MKALGTKGGWYEVDDGHIDEGAEADIRPIKGTGNMLVAKMYKPGVVTPDLTKKVEHLVSHPMVGNAVEHLAWPIDVLYGHDGSMTGFVMERKESLEEIQELYAYPRKGPNVTLRHLIAIARNLSAQVQNVHDAGYVIGDLSARNIGVDRSTGVVTLYDIDSLQVHDPTTGMTYRCRVGTPGYIAPELLARATRFAKTHPSSPEVYLCMPLPTFTQETDRFCLAIHVFRLLNNGFYPFCGCPVGTPASEASPGTDDEAVAAGSYCFGEGLAPLPQALPARECLPPYIDDLFERAFVKGATNPGARPTGREWYDALGCFGHELTHCSKDATHFYYTGAPMCPWCEADHAFRKNLQMVLAGGHPTVALATPAAPGTPTRGRRVGRLRARMARIRRRGLKPHRHGTKAAGVATHTLGYRAWEVTKCVIKALGRVVLFCLKVLGVFAVIGLIWFFVAFLIYLL